MTEETRRLMMLQEREQVFQRYLRARERIRRIHELATFADKALTMQDEEMLGEHVSALVRCAESLQSDIETLPW